MSLYSSFSPKTEPKFTAETKTLITRNKKAFNFYQDTHSFIDKNKIELKNLYKKVKEKHKIQATDPYYMITIMNKVYNEYFMQNPEILDILKEFNTNKSIEELKLVRTQAQINRIFALKSLAKKERKLIYYQMIYEFNPLKNYHDLNYSEDLTEFLKKNEKIFLKE